MLNYTYAVFKKSTKLNPKITNEHHPAQMILAHENVNK